MRLLVALLILACAVGVAWWIGPRRDSFTPSVDAPVAAEPTAESTPPPSFTPSVTSPPPPPVLPEAHPWSAALCPEDMVWVGPRSCPRSRPEPRGCAEGKRKIAVCMDPFEYPNQAGVLPAVMLDYRLAEDVCKSEGKRLCTETEWTFACESVTDPTGCNFGHTELTVRTQELTKPERVSVEIAAQDGRRKNDESSCVNEFRVFDLLGNVQEWVRSEHPEPRVGGLKGGRYNQVSIGCGRTIYVSDPWSRYPHTGVRCCADPLAVAPSSP